jgi:hypothetical protein
MSPRLTKPVVHGRDHSAGGSDPIPGGVSGQVEWEDVGTGAGAGTALPPQLGMVQTPYPNGLIAVTGDWRRFTWQPTSYTVLQVLAGTPDTITLKLGGFYILTGYVLEQNVPSDTFQLQLNWPGDIIHSSGAGASGQSAGAVVTKIGWVSGTGNQFVTMDVLHTAGSDRQFAARLEIACLYQGVAPA